MKVIHHEIRYRFGIPFTIVMAEGCVNDVAVYDLRGRHDPEHVARHGHKWTEHNNAVEGIPIPEGKHYRR